MELNYNFEILCCRVLQISHLDKGSEIVIATAFVSASINIYACCLHRKNVSVIGCTRALGRDNHEPQ